MALKLNKQITVLPVGRVSIDCYVKVASIAGDKENMIINICFTKESSSGDLVASERYAFTPDMNGENFIRQAYLHLKTFPEFAGAEDC
jgi:hypothetical protein